MKTTQGTRDDGPFAKGLHPSILHRSAGSRGGFTNLNIREADESKTAAGHRYRPRPAPGSRLGRALALVE